MPHTPLFLDFTSQLHILLQLSLFLSGQKGFAPSSWTWSHCHLISLFPPPPTSPTPDRSWREEERTDGFFLRAPPPSPPPPLRVRRVRHRVFVRPKEGPALCQGGDLARGVSWEKGRGRCQETFCASRAIVLCVLRTNSTTTFSIDQGSG